MAVTIRDVAKKLNISITTVSRALDGYQDVAESTRQEVIRAAQELGYVPNRAARQLRRQRTDTIGYILPSSSPRFSEPFYAEFVAGLGDEASQHQVDLLVASAPPATGAEQELYQRWVQGRKADGLIINRTRLEDWRVDYLVQQEFPFVGLERAIDPRAFPRCGFVEVEGVNSFADLISYLAGHGHRRIALIGGPDSLKIQADRLAGYQAGLENNHLPFDPALVESGNLTWEAGVEASARLLARPDPPTAITCVNDRTALGVYHTARQLGRVIGRDLAVTGFDGTEDSRRADPPLTTLDQPLYEIARQMVQMLLAIIAGDPLPERVVQLQPELRLRQSA